jgi:hypothetical protein
MAAEEKVFGIRFNQILSDEMSKHFELTPLPLDPDLKRKCADQEGKGAVIESQFLGCPKTSGIRMGEMDFAGSMTVHFGSVPPGKNYNLPILGFTFVYASKFLIGVLDLHPLSRDTEYLNMFIEPLKDIPPKYENIPFAEGGRREVHDWAKFYDSGYSFYRWCDGRYLPDLEEAFKDYIRVYCECIKKAEPLNDQKEIEHRSSYMEKYTEDYTYKDPGSAPLQHHFGEEWSERFLKGFLFAN